MQNTISLDQKEKKDLLTAFPRGLVAFDLEMTGLSAIVDKIIEIAAVKITPDGKIETFHRLVNPLIEIPPDTIQFHNITNDMVKDCPSLKKPFKEFIKFYGDFSLVAHNAQFDASYVVRAHHQLGEKLGLSDVYDSCKMARSLFKNAPEGQKPENFKLGTLAEYYSIEFNHHQALDDAMVCLKIFSRLLAKLQIQNKTNELRTKAMLFKLNSFKKATDYLLPKKFDLLKDALLSKQEVTIDYRGTNNVGDRKVKPIALLPLPQGLVLYAFCKQSDMNKHFLINKIKAVTT